MSDTTIDQPSTGEIRTFVALASGAGIAGFNFGFDLGAFDNVDHRKLWAVWVLCTVALVSSYLFRNSELSFGDGWRFVLLVPSLWLLAAGVWATSNSTVVTILVVLSVATLPFAAYLLLNMVAPAFFELSGAMQLALGGLTLFIVLVGFYIGADHTSFLTCSDFELAGEFTPADCTP